MFDHRKRLVRIENNDKAAMWVTCFSSLQLSHCWHQKSFLELSYFDGIVPPVTDDLPFDLWASSRQCDTSPNSFVLTASFFVMLSLNQRNLHLTWFTRANNSTSRLARLRDWFVAFDNWRRYVQHNRVTELWLAHIHINWKQTLVRTCMRVFVILLMSNEYQSEHARIPTYKNTKWLNKQCPTHNTNTTYRQTQTANPKNKHTWHCLMWNLLRDTTPSNTQYANDLLSYSGLAIARLFRDDITHFQYFTHQRYMFSVINVIVL